MALGRISGAMLQGNLERGGHDLAFETNLLYLDVTNNRIGIGNTSPGHSLEVSGQTRIGDVLINGNTIAPTGSSTKVSLGAETAVSITGGSSGEVLSTDGSGNLSWSTLGSLMGGSGTDGMSIILGTPTDSSLVTEAAWDGWLSSTKVTDAIDNLNQVALNIAKDTFVGQADFTASVTSGPSPLTVSFTSSHTGNANTYHWDFGDSTTSTQQNPTKTYSNTSGGQFTVLFRASNNNGTFSGVPASGAVGSYDDVTKTNHITLYTPNPIPAFTLTDADIDEGATAEITNTSQFSTSYDLDWGDSTLVNPPSGWTTQTHVYSTVSGDTEYAIQLDATSTTAGPSPVTVTGTPQDIRIYRTHSPAFTSTSTTLANEEATSGGVVTFTNTTATGPGATSTFSTNRYKWTWGDGAVDTINVQSGVAGNPGSTIDHAFSLSNANQANGVSETFDVTLQVINLHSTSPFTSSTTTVKIEPDVRCNIAATAVTVSTASGDNQYDLYDFTDLDSNNRALVRATNTSQNADSYVYTWNDGDTDNVTENGSSAGSIGAPLDHNYAGESTGNYTLSVAASGTPDTISQTDTDADQTFTINATPTAAPNLSTKPLTLADGAQGSSPLLCHGFTDNTSTFTSQVPGANLNTTTSRRYTSGTIDTNVVQNFITNHYNGTNQTVTAKINNVAGGARTYTTSEGGANNGTDASLVHSHHRDYDEIVSSTSQRTYLVATAKITLNITGYAVGSSAQRIESSAGGNTNFVHVVKDDLTSTPTLDINSATLTQASAGTLKYISGVPYYNDSSNSITISGVDVTNWMGQAYRSGSNFYIQDGPNDESTSQSILNTQTKSYADIDGASTMLSGGIPIADSGKSSAYSLGNFSFSIDRSARAVAQVQAYLRNVNGDSSTVTFPTKFNVYSQSITGFDEETISVPSSLGGTFTDNGKRVALGLSGDNPSYTAADFFTNNAFTGATTVAGTDEAIVRWGTLQHFDSHNFSTGYLPAGPDLATGRSGAQYFTFAFRRTTLANFDIRITTSTGIAGFWLAAPGTGIDASAGPTNGWIDGNASYAGAGLPGTDTSNGGNGDAGCALTSSDRVPLNTAISNTAYTMTLGSENLSNASGKNCLVRVRLDNGQTLDSISIEAAA